MGGDKGFSHDGSNATCGETSMSIDETNKLRISLGLKPLQATADKPRSSSSAKLPPPQLDAEKTKELAERVKAAREKRRQQQLLDSTKTLGEEEPELDDIEKWVQKSRVTTTKKETAAGTTTNNTATKDDDDKDGMRALAGARIRQVDLAEGETTILTLQDKGILNDRGELADDEDEDGNIALALENIQTREDKDRREAYRAGSKKHAKPLWEEDGKKRSLLDKYDEEEEEMLVLGDRGDVKVDLEQQKQAAKAKLAAAIASAAGGGREGATAITGGSDYYTAEEMAAFSKPKKKKKKDRKLKKKALTAEDIAVLEEGNAGGGGGGDLGSRGDGEERAARETEAAAEEEAERRARFEAALTKANYASLALKPTYQQELGDEDEEDDLYVSLGKARRLAQQTSGKSTARGADANASVVKPEDIAQQVAQRREAAFMKRDEPSSSLLGGDQLTFNDLSGFTRTITAVAASGGGVGGVGGGGVKKEEVKEDEKEDEDVSVVGRKQYRRRHHDEDGDEVMRDASTSTMVHHNDDDDDDKDDAQLDQEGINATANDKYIYSTESITQERAIGTGLGSILGLLKERGELNKPIEWGGRTNDSKKSALVGLEDVYTGGSEKDKYARDVEAALTRRDEYGRIITPKEAYRQLCYDFHGIRPSKNTLEKRKRQVEKEMAKRNVASGATEAKSIEAVKTAQKAAATPYIVMSGTIQPGQRRDAAGVGGMGRIDEEEEGGGRRKKRR